jgi:hypothetical protein
MFGYKGYSAHLIMFNAIKNDILNTNISISKKIWAYRRGFLGFRAQVFEINETNYLKYIPDFDYFKLHPINGKYSKWIDDKLIIKYLLSKFDKYLPAYYFQIVDGKIIKLMDCPKEISSDFDGLYRILKEKGTLALKLIVGSRGKGFYKLTHHNGKYYLNMKKISKYQLQNHLNSLNDYIVTEYIFSHKIIRNLYNATPNAVRIQLIKGKNSKIFITESHIKIGTKESGIYEHAAAGAIFAKVNIKSGQLTDAYRIDRNKLRYYDFHPDTKLPLQISLPHWTFIKSQLKKIFEYIPQLSYLGFDIIITDDGFKIIEINSLSALLFPSYFYPHFENETLKTFFGDIVKNNPKNFDRIIKRLEKKL